MNMSKMQTRWTEAAMIPIRNEINKLTQTGETRANAYKLLAAKHNTTLNYMRKLCTSGPDKLREDARKYKRSSVRGAVTRHVSSRTNTGTTMSAQDAMEFYMFLKQMNITIA
jgi:hypothetical protein